MPRKILLAVDGSKTSEAMLHWAERNVLRADDQILLIHVRQRPSDLYILDPKYESQYNIVDDAVSAP